MDMALFSQIGLIFLKGTAIAVLVTVVCQVVSTALAVVLTIVDISGPRPFSIVIRAYSWLAQTIPPLILLFAVFFGFTSMGFQVSPIVSTIIAFAVFSTAYNFEILRASYEAVPTGQTEAARALGLSLVKTFRLVILPQLVPIAALPYIGRATVLFKETSLASSISVPEIMGATNGLVYSGANPLLLIAISGAIYAAVSVCIISCGKLLTRPKFMAA